MTNEGCLLRIQTSLENVVGIGARSPREYRARRYHTSKDKLQIKETAMNQEISEKKVTATILNVLHLIN